MVQNVLANHRAPCPVKRDGSQDRTVGRQEKITVHRGVQADQQMSRHPQRDADRRQNDNGGSLAEEQDADAILLRSHKLQEDEITAGVKAIGRAGAGTNNVPVDHCSSRGIPVFNAPGANANAVKELVMAGLLLGSRGIVEGIAYANGLSDMQDADEMNKLLEKEKPSLNQMKVKSGLKQLATEKEAKSPRSWVLTLAQSPSAIVQKMAKTGLTTPKISSPFRTRDKATTTTMANSRIKPGIASPRKLQRNQPP